MKNRIFVFSVLLFFTTFLSAQEDESSIEKFDGGDVKIGIRLSTDLIMGPTSCANTIGHSISSLYSNAASTYWNPAGLGFLKDKAEFTIDWGVSIPIDLKRFGLDLQEEINSGVDDLLEDDPDAEKIYPKIHEDLDISGGIKYVGLAFPIGKGFGIGFSSSRLLDFGVDFLNSGFEGKVKVGEEPLDYNFYYSMETNLKCNVNANLTTFGIGKEVYPHWVLGLSFDFYSIDADLSSALEIDGIMTKSGTEEMFNTGIGNDTLKITLLANFSGKKFGAKFGTGYHLVFPGKDNKISFDLVFAHPLDISMDGNLELLMYVHPAFRFEDIEYEDIEPAHPTRTEREVTRSNYMKLRIPGYLSISPSLKLGVFIGSFTYSRYFGELSYEYKASVEDPEGMEWVDSDAKAVLKNGFHLGLDFHYFRLGGGVITGKFKNEEEVRIFIPSFAIGTGFSITSLLRVDTILVGLALPVSKLTLTYLF